MRRNKKTEYKRKKRQSWDDILFTVISNLILILLVIIVAYPIYFIVVASFTEPQHVNSGGLLLWPKDFTLLGYQRVFQDNRVWTGYFNTIVYTISGTFLGTVATMLAGYALSRKDLVFGSTIMKLMVFTMYFSGGMIPFYLVVRNMGLVDTRMLMIILGSISVYNIIVVKSFMESTIPDELLDAATIDGCGNGSFFLRIVVPLSKAVMAVIVLYIAVSYWNSYFNAMIFLMDRDKYPLQLFLREILLAGAAVNSATQGVNPEEAAKLEMMVMVIRYCVIVVATVPILCVYPFIQKYFVKGVMIGSVKG